VVGRRVEAGGGARQTTAGGQRKTVGEIIRRKTDMADVHRASGGPVTGAIEGPNLVTHLPDVVVQSDHLRQLPFRITKQACNYRDCMG